MRAAPPDLPGAQTNDSPLDRALALLLANEAEAALRFAEAGHKVTGFDVDPKKVTMLNAGKSYIEHIPQTKIQQFVNSKHFGATTDFARLKDADAIIICVPTPLDERREPDLSYVENTAIAIQPHLQKGQLVVLE